MSASFLPQPNYFRSLLFLSLAMTPDQVKSVMLGENQLRCLYIFNCKLCYLHPKFIAIEIFSVLSCCGAKFDIIGSHKDAEMRL